MDALSPVRLGAPAERAQVEGFFDLTLIMNPPAPNEDELPPIDPPPAP